MFVLVLSTLAAYLTQDIGNSISRCSNDRKPSGCYTELGTNLLLADNSPISSVITQEINEKAAFDTANIVLGLFYALAFGSCTCIDSSRNGTPFTNGNRLIGFKATNWADQNPNFLAVLGAASTAEVSSRWVEVLLEPPRGTHVEDELSKVTLLFVSLYG